MKSINITIGEVNFSINCDNTELTNILHKEFSYYSYNSDSQNSVEINVSTNQHKTRGIKSQNPKFIQLNDKNTFSYFGSTLAYTMEVEKKITIDAYISTYKNPLLRFVRKWLNMGFNNRIERAGQIIHENLIVPLFYFFQGHGIVHASSFSNKKRGMLISGTGGVGKTSLEIALCSMQENIFLSDDICIVKNEKVYPNFSFPKIYAYNLVNDPKLKHTILKKRNLLDQLQWKVKSLKGKDKVRRRISPEILYGEITSQPVPFEAVITLVKSNTDKLMLKEISPETSAKLNIEIIKNEYAEWFKVLRWVDINQHYLSSPNEIFSVDNRLREMEQSLLKTFSTGKTYILEIPLSIPHDVFKKEASKIIMNLMD